MFVLFLLRWMSSAANSGKSVQCASTNQSKDMSDLVPSNSRYWLGLFSSLILLSSRWLLVSTCSFTMSRRGEWGSNLKLKFREQENLMCLSLL